MVEIFLNIPESFGKHAIRIIGDCDTKSFFLKNMSSKLSLTNSQFYLKIAPCYCASPLRPAVRPLASRPLYPHMIMCKNAIAACNDKNVWLQSVYIFPLFTNEKNGIWLLSFFLPQKLTPLSLDTQYHTLF